MKKQDLQSAIETVIERTFTSITNLYNKQGAITRLIFPKYTHGSNKGKLRVSEQELRQLFIEELNRYADETGTIWQYSVETPTNEKYKFPEKGTPKVDKNGVSGRFDLTIWVDGKMAVIIEFKAGNAAPHEYDKDLCKLTNKNEGERDTMRFFVNILESANAATKDSIKKKFDKHNPRGKEMIRLYFYAMNDFAPQESFPYEFRY